MLGTHDLALFVISGLLLNMAPGPDSLLIMARSATQGWRAGSAAALGIGAGTTRGVWARTTDLIFGVICEEWGFLFGLLLVLSFVAIAVSALVNSIAARCGQRLGFCDGGAHSVSRQSGWPPAWQSAR